MPGAKQEVSEIELDLGRYELRRRGRPVKLEKKPMELLIFLVSRRNQLVSRRDIITKLWRSDVFIDAEPAINNVIRKIRTALGDTSAKPRFLETVVGKGYRFTGPVRVIHARFQCSELEGSPAVEANWEGLSVRDERPSLAVLPLCLLGNSPDDRGVCLGFADALVSRLGNLQGVNVLPTSAMLNVPVDMSASDVGSRLGVRFVIHGAIRESKGQWRLSLQMFDTHLQGAGFSRKCDLDVNRLCDLEDEIARQIASALNRPLRPQTEQRPRYSRDQMAYAEFVRGYRLSSSGDTAVLDEAIERLSNAATRDPNFALAHATLSLACATRYFEFDPASKWLEKAEFHCRRALELSPDLAEGHVANAFLLWGPSKNFQHLDAIAELRRAISLQKNLPHAYNRLGTILAHIGLLDRAREMYERGRPFQPKKAANHSVVQVYVWNHELDLAREEIQAWRAENPGNKYAIYFAPQLAMMTGDWNEARALLDDAVRVFPQEPMIVSLLGLYFALVGKAEQALECVARACGTAKSFGHSHHTYYQVACIYAILERREAAFEWLERSVGTGFACWPFFLKDIGLENLRTLPEFEVLVSALQAKYPDYLGLL
ncbi:winged helix-turn-helix domain-containing protein [Alloacidobacterium dinghuense]|uniref:Winged helix-turn-helix domain-containing protein n=1 Tax=Alloacidobacterium dinghuense TaxID=2763107 RepID=A0A7G8BI23_9BACT|nr:winged helix-turn-helix domain-containing protein [Alloacidobacterium dinghuense]QNI32193.1 winged helix-turn-helix domain-containing protein [Alloacidobacterium dinghuense]